MEKQQFTYDYPRPAVTTDCVVFGLDGPTLKVLLIERGKEPFKGCWAFPGGFLNMDETAEQCAARELKEETGLDLHDMKQIGAFSDVNRDPRGRVITIAFYALTTVSAVQGSDDAAQAKWFALNDLPQLTFDHDHILREARMKLHEELSKGRITPERITSLGWNEIFVFGSNLEGAHGGGAARIAVEKFGAIWGQGVGLQGKSYGIPTMQGGVETIKPYVDEFIAFAKQHHELTFLVTRIGCGIAGFTTEEIAPLFAAAINEKHIHLPLDFWTQLI